MALHPIPFKAHGARSGRSHDHRVVHLLRHISGRSPLRRLTERESRLITWARRRWLPWQVHPEERSGIAGVLTSGKFIAALANVTQAAHDLYHFTRRPQKYRVSLPARWLRRRSS
ncbi:hypothetical protein C8R45DRAFT_1113849 [Mycena sanguinolenta]|nr:hypothetical protein C8R45DRAFT_1113849 [Mycena sanguinolenta]